MNLVFQGVKISRGQHVRGHRPSPRRPASRVENFRLEVYPEQLCREVQPDHPCQILSRRGPAAQRREQRAHLDAVPTVFPRPAPLARNPEVAPANDEKVAQVLAQVCVEVGQVGHEVGGREGDRVVRDEASLGVGVARLTVRLHLDIFASATD